MSKGLEELSHIVGYDAFRYENELSIIEKELKRLEAIDNANPSEALEFIKMLLNASNSENHFLNLSSQDIKFELIKIEQALLKAQEQEKENELLKEIIKSLFIGSPLHPYTDNGFGYTIEVDDEYTIMHLGEFKSVDLDKKLNEVLKNDNE